MSGRGEKEGTGPASSSSSHNDDDGDVDDFTPTSAVLITGGAGFIASHVATLLVERYPKYKVVVLDNLEYCGSLQNLRRAKDKKNFFFVEGDILSCDQVRDALERHGVDTVLHFAAQTHVDNSFGNSLEFTMTNVYGTHSLLEACRVYGKIRRFVNVSTDEVYGEQSFGSGQSSCEKSVLEPTNPYSAAKAGAEMMVTAYSKSYGLPCITTRGNNVYGPGQFPEKLVPKLILLARRGAKLPIHGSGESRRSFLHVDDVKEAYDLILHKGVVGEVYNIGTQRERRVLDVAEDVCALGGLDPAVHVEHVADRRYNDRRYFISDAKVRGLGWSPRVDWPEGLRRTYEWYAETDLSKFWRSRDIEEALKPHPTFRRRGSHQG